MTRCCPPLSFEDAARVQEILLGETLAKARLACAGSGAQLFVCHSPDSGGEYFRSEGTRLMPQGEGDLGERMFRCLREVAAAGFDTSILVGTDIPGLTEEIMTAALSVLENRDAAFGPSRDGGYYLVGFRGAPPPTLFRRMAWSTPWVMEETRRRLGEAGLTWGEVSRLADLDRFEELKHLETQGFRSFSPGARAALSEILAAYPS